MMKKFQKIAVVCLVLVLAVSLAMAGRSWWEQRSGAQAYEEAVAAAHPHGQEDDQPSGGGAQQDAPGAAQDPDDPDEADEAVDPKDLDLEALRAINPDVVGWIEIPGTVLSYPLLQGSDNQYYLNHTWNRKRNSMGAIYLEHTSSPALDGFHTIIYGHRMNNDSMFGSLRHYSRADYWRQHPSVYLVTDSGRYRYDIFAAYQANITGLVYRLDLESSHLEEEFIQSCVDSSVLDTGIVPDASDRILTLSTCVNLSYSSNRWVVQAVLRESLPAE